MVLEWMGHLGGLLIAIALFPQLLKTIRTKSTKDISLLWTIVLIIGLASYVIYAIPNKIIPIAIFGSVELAMSVTMLILKIKYG